jgi:hypothetical protein
MYITGNNGRIIINKLVERGNREREKATVHWIRRKSVAVPVSTKMEAPLSLHSLSRLSL